MVSQTQSVQEQPQIGVRGRHYITKKFRFGNQEFTLTAERTNYGVRIQMPIDPEDKDVAVYEAQRFRQDIPHYVRLVKVIANPKDAFIGFNFYYSILSRQRDWSWAGWRHSSKGDLASEISCNSVEAEAFELLLKAEEMGI